MAAPKTTPSDDTEAFLDNFKALSFEQQKSILIACQAILTEEAEKQRSALLEKLAELDALTGRPDAALNSKQAEAGRTVKPKGPVTHRGPNGEEYRQGAGRGTKPKWLQTLLDEGRTLDEFRVAV